MVKPTQSMGNACDMAFIRTKRVTTDDFPTAASPTSKPECQYEAPKK